MLFGLIKCFLIHGSLWLLLIANSALASCLDRPPFTNIADNDPVNYVELIFPICSRTNECKIALSGLDNLRFIDADKYAYIKGCALANGDCMQQNLPKAQQLLESCAQKSYTCKKALMYMYAVHMPDQMRYNKLALELIKEGLDDVALSYMIDYYLAQNCESGSIKAYFMSAILLINTDKTIKKYEQNCNNIRKIQELEEYKDYLVNFIKNLSKSITKEKREAIWNEAEEMIKWHNTAQKSDPLTHLDRIYGIIGDAKTQPALIHPKDQEPRMNKDVTQELKQILEELENLRR